MLQQGCLQQSKKWGQFGKFRSCQEDVNPAKDMFLTVSTWLKSCKPQNCTARLWLYKPCLDMFGPHRGTSDLATWRCQGSVQRLSTLLRSSGLQSPVDLLKASISGVEITQGNRSWYVQKLIYKPPQDRVFTNKSSKKTPGCVKNWWWETSLRHSENAMWLTR